MLKLACYSFSAVNDLGTDEDNSQVLCVETTINHNRTDEADWDADIVITVKSRIDKKWVTEDFGLDPFNKDTAIALRDFLIFCFPLDAS